MGMKVAAALSYLGMVSVQFIQVGLMVAIKAATASGMTKFIFVFYSNALAALVLLPTSFVAHRSNRPPITFSLLCKFFLLALFGCIAQVTGNVAIQITPASFVSAILNLIPGFTFMLAVILRMEEVDYRSSSTLAKSIGTLVSIGGAFIVTLYKGPSILMTTSDSDIIPRQLLMQQSNLIIGGLLLVVDCLASSAFIIAQGIIGSATQVSLMVWCLHKRGPLFVAVFHPLGIVIAAAVGIIFLGDILYLGSLVGSVVIVIGFYSVMWGKAKEQKVTDDNRVSSLESTSEEAPLLQKIKEAKV